MAGSRSILNATTIEQIRKVGRTDCLIGIPSYGDSDTISHVISTAGEGVTRYLPGLKAVIVNAYGDTRENRNTGEAALKTPVPSGIQKIVTHYRGLPGKGSAFRTVFEIADRLKARICMTLDADLRSIQPRWIRLLADPIYRYNFGFVTPLYHRHKHDGTITNSIAYPLTRALYGLQVRQPIGGEFCFSGALAKILSHQDVWETDIARFGIDVWMTTTAITEGFRLCQASMGVKLHNPKDPSTDLAPMFHQVVGTLFRTMGEHEVKWKAIEGSTPVPNYGGPSRHRELREKDVSPLHLIARFKAGFRAHQAFYRHYLSDAVYRSLAKMSVAGPEDFIFPEELWAKLIYDFAVIYNFSGEDTKLTVGAVTPIYYGRTASFMLEVKGMSSVMVESLIEGQARVFELYKPYLLRRWDETKRRTDKQSAR